MQYIPSEYLSGLVPVGIYKESKLYELGDAIGIGYNGAGVLTSRRIYDKPYPSYGRNGAVDVHRTHELKKVASDTGVVWPKDYTIDRALFGWEIIVGVWRCCGPIMSPYPPSAVIADPDIKARLDLKSLRRMGL